MSVTSNIVIARLVTASRLDANRMRRGGWLRQSNHADRAISGSTKLGRSDLVGLRVQQQASGQYACRARTARDR
jgi:hypothetical protein